jgi:hypothetical protein
MKRWVILVALAFFALVQPAAATTVRSRSEDPRIVACVQRAARGHDWLEKTLWGLRYQEAGWLGAEVANTNGTHDLGPLQINSAWVPRIARLVGRPEHQVRYWLRYDACFNADVARWIFLSGLKASGDYWKAIGIYHSPTGWRQRAYAAEVANHMRRAFGPNVFVRRATSETGMHSE